MNSHATTHQSSSPNSARNTRTRYLPTLTCSYGGSSDGEGYAKHFGEDPDLWYLTGYLHDLDYEEHPSKHPGPSLGWFAAWDYPEALIHAVEAHAYGHNGFTTLPQTPLASALMACDEICGIFYAYQKLNPIPFHEMKVKSIKKRLKEKSFAAKIDRETVYLGAEKLGIELGEHIQHLIGFFAVLEE